MKRTLCILLSLMLAVTGLAGLCMTANALNYGDIIQFGSYPQMQVSETTALKNAANAATWKSYGYYIGTGSFNGNMEANDFMKYADFVSDGIQYRAVKFTIYRPYNTAYTPTADKSTQDDNGFSTSTTYYFRYDPLEWRVLDPLNGYILCESIIDAQAYQNVVRESGTVGYVGSTSTYANNYASSTIRTWLNNDFYNTAFNSVQKENIKNTTIDNYAYSDTYSQYHAAPTTDPIFLLNYNEAQKSKYGLSFDSERKVKGTDYAKCQGLSVDNSGFSRWWLRSAGSQSSIACSVDSTGKLTNNKTHVCSTSTGIRPACQLSNLTFYVYSVTATTDPAEGGTVTGGGIYESGAYATLTATSAPGWHFVGWYLDGTLSSTQQSFFRPVVSNLAYIAKFEKDAPVNPTQNAKLNVPQSTEVGYKSTVTVTATAEDVPEGYFVALYESDTQLAKGDNKTVSCTIKKMKAGKTLTAKIIDSNGNVQSNADGKLEKEIKITVKTGFFDKVKAFFLGLFGLLPKITLNP